MNNAKNNYAKKNYKRLNFVIPNSLGDKFKEKCDASGLSMNAAIANMVVEFLDQGDPELFITEKDGWNTIAHPTTYKEAMDILTRIGIDDYELLEKKPNGELKVVDVEWFKGKAIMTLPK